MRVFKRRMKTDSDYAPLLLVGNDWNYVLLSTVRSLPQRDIDHRPSDRWTAENLGAVTDPHEINVAITRARQGLIIIGMYARTLLSSVTAFMLTMQHTPDSARLRHCLARSWNTEPKTLA